jgi:hypothetical protein
MKSLTSQGFVMIYNFPYSHTTTINEFLVINSSCSQSTILCVGGYFITSENILLLSCGNCWSILSYTQVNKTNYLNGAFW